MSPILSESASKFRKRSRCVRLCNKPMSSVKNVPSNHSSFKNVFFFLFLFRKKSFQTQFIPPAKTGRYLFFFCIWMDKDVCRQVRVVMELWNKSFFFLFTIKEEEKRWNTQICIVEIGSLNLNYNNTVDVFRLHIAIWLQSVSFTTTKSNK